MTDFYEEYWRMRDRLSAERRDHRLTKAKLDRAREDIDVLGDTNAALQQSVNELSARIDSGDKPEPLIFLPIKKYNTKPAQPKQPFEMGDVVLLKDGNRLADFRIINIKFEQGRWQIFLWGLSTWHDADLFLKRPDTLVVGDRVRRLSRPESEVYEIYLIKEHSGITYAYLSRVNDGRVLDYPYTLSALVKVS